MINVLKNFLTKKFFWGSKIDKHLAVFYLILLWAFIVRIVNINYNSAFNDEAIYIVIGRMGLFANDWWSYGAKLWMAGVPYVYPTLTALAYQIGGLVGSRLLNVIFGVLLIEEIYRFTKLINLFDEQTNKLASLIAAFIAAFSGIGIFVSKLATYDMPSFLLLMLGINSFLKAKNFSDGKYYFLTFFFLFTAFLTKIVVGVFLPILFIFSVFILRKRSKEHQKAAIKYLYALFVLGIIGYLYFYSDNFLTYVSTHKNLGAGSYSDIINLIWQEAYILWLLLIPSIAVFLASKKTKVIASLLMLVFAIPLFHVVLQRFATLDKHVYLSVMFLAPIVGYAISTLVFGKYRLIGLATIAIIPISAFLFLINSYDILNTRQYEWANTVSMQKYLQSKIMPGDKVLTEEGGVVVLALYDKIFPPKSIVTFDWIDYSGIQGDKGYAQAVDDVYFDYIEMDTNGGGNDILKMEVDKNLFKNYSLVYNKDNFNIYEKRK